MDGIVFSLAGYLRNVLTRMERSDATEDQISSAYLAKPDQLWDLILESPDAVYSIVAARKVVDRHERKVVRPVSGTRIESQTKNASSPLKEAISLPFTTDGIDVDDESLDGFCLI